MKDLLTYADVSGKLRLRSYVKVSIFILAALIVLAVVAFWQQSQQRQAIAVTKPVAVAQTVAPVSTITTAPSATPEACPSDPEDWTLVEGLPGTEFMRIEPACVYDGLERTVAFALAINMGYSRQAAIDALDFDEIPIEGSSPVTIANPNGPLSMDVNFSPAVPGFTEWFFDVDEQPGTTLSLQGCFRTYTIIGTEKQDWGQGYPVICRLAYDTELSNSLACMDNHCFTSPINVLAFRKFAVFGYAGNGRWAWVGTEVDGTEIDSQTLQDDRAVSTKLQGVGPWDEVWLEQAYNLTMQPLPEKWKTFTDVAEIQIIVDAINAYMGGTSP